MFKRGNLEAFYNNSTIEGCPFCGGMPSLWIDTDEENPQAQCRCEACGARGSIANEKTVRPHYQNGRATKNDLNWLAQHAINFWRVRRA